MFSCSTVQRMNKQLLTKSPDLSSCVVVSVCPAK